ncbi:MAG: FAD-binding molybdopterin dehydrogenase [Sphingobacteriales bacterium SCN 48-20]|uniref:FAD binding domain-containing protein n=1 Tax=Terrimonas ferruginea TaxID=249 RepID=UPI00086884DB|nr:xanthine dehydrogenase family protein subunit M [Terrimonas ferruginea]MBN8784993.1 xanthine dehydrogenase family protein subunit M [Terrimonas ferruginea]ODT91875.1 MAG: FAD-binding molybdopterin dehydrogenase [Sphingobacteriales bacterium SCN 48-20]OJW41999.1 MAG: FAD-binding molybdopterin dehydrogenase [Sphingobacteriales bacterium 48-107]
MINFDYLRTASVNATLNAIKREPRAAFIAGGTNLVDLMKRGVTSPPRLIDINNLPLKNIERTSSGISIGALATNSAVAVNEMIRSDFPLLSQALHAGASPQLRNMATVGGNMLQRTRCTYFYDTTMPCNKRQAGSGCGAIGGYNRMHAIFGASDKCIAVHPSDMCVALVALNATVVVRSAKGERRIPFGDFHRLPADTPQTDNQLKAGELITAVEIPSNKFQQHSFYLKIRDRSSYAFALVSVAAALSIENNRISDARIAAGGVAHKPWRLLNVEKALIGQPASVDTFQKAASIAIQGAKGYGQNSFKLKLLPQAIIQALETATS